VDQLNQILGILGTPDEETLVRVGSDRVSFGGRYADSVAKLINILLLGASIYSQFAQNA
jgi:hypothetical protein